MFKSMLMCVRGTRVTKQLTNTSNDFRTMSEIDFLVLLYCILIFVLQKNVFACIILFIIILLKKYILSH